jgi:ketosteroid isomerase-like protein
MRHPNEQTLRDAYADFARGDLAAYLARCTDDIVFRVPGRNPLAGTYTKEQFITPWITGVMAACGGTFRETVLDVFANDTRGVVLAHHAFERGGRTYEYDTAHLYRIENGKLAAFEEYPDDLYRFDEAWG